MFDAYQHYFEMPTLPFTILVGVVAAYWLLIILGAFDLDFLDLDLDLDGHTDASWVDWGMVGLRWFNLSDVPLMVWLSVFGVSAWGTSLYFDQEVADRGTREMLTAILRNVGVGLLAAKAITQPLKGKLKLVEPNRVEELLGRTCVVTTVDATETFGQAQCAAEGAPLLLNVRTIDGAHPQGTIVEIVDYDADEKVFVVRAAQQEAAGANT